MESEGHKCTSIRGGTGESGMDKSARDKVVKEFRWVFFNASAHGWRQLQPRQSFAAAH
jgi:hypothetical protein